MKRGEVWWVNFAPSVGGEMRKRCPAVIISNDTSNRFLNRVQVVPLTTKRSAFVPQCSLVTPNDRQHKAMADQLATVSKRRLLNLAGRLSGADMRRVKQVIKVQLGLMP